MEVEVSNQKWKDGEAITRHIDTSEADAAIAELRRIEHEPTLVLAWIENTCLKS